MDSLYYRQAAKSTPALFDGAFQNETFLFVTGTDPRVAAICCDLRPAYFAAGLLRPLGV